MLTSCVLTLCVCCWFVTLIVFCLFICTRCLDVAICKKNKKTNYKQHTCCSQEASSDWMIPKSPFSVLSNSYVAYKPASTLFIYFVITLPFEYQIWISPF